MPEGHVGHCIKANISVALAGAAIHLKETGPGSVSQTIPAAGLVSPWPSIFRNPTRCPSSAGQVSSAMIQAIKWPVYRPHPSCILKLVGDVRAASLP